MANNHNGKIDWGFDHLHDIIAPLTNVERTSNQQAFGAPSLERSKTILDACQRAKSRLDLFIENLEADIAAQQGETKC